jgi:LysM domain
MKTCLNPAGKWPALRNMLCAAALVMMAGYVSAQDKIELNPAHPKSYVVQRGDTLWDISGKFLQQPWYWPEIWSVNPQIENPHLIFPGDVLNLVYVDGQPRIQLTRGPVTPTGTERLSPSIRTSDLDSAITSIPASAIKPFLTGGMIMPRKEVEKLPYVVALNNHMVGGAGQNVYVMDLPEENLVGDKFFVVRMANELRDPDTGKVLGNEVTFIAKAELRQQGTPGRRGTPATMFLTDTNREVNRGDRVLKADLNLPMNYFPSAPAEEVSGQIISVVDGLSRIGQFNMVILNRGTVHGLTEGNVLAVWQKGNTVNDNINTRRGRDYSSRSQYSLAGKKVTLPDTFAGNLMIIKAYDDVSYALVMEAVSEMRVLDRVANP